MPPPALPATVTAWFCTAATAALWVKRSGSLPSRWRHRSWRLGRLQHDGNVPDRRHRLGCRRDWLRLGRATKPGLNPYCCEVVTPCGPADGARCALTYTRE